MKRFVLLVLLLGPSAAMADVPAEGVAYTPARGFFTETDLGAFFTVGGRDGYSNLATYLQLGIGVDLTQHLEVGVHFGLGTSNTNCFAAGTATNGTCSEAPSFTAALVDLWFGYLIPVADRLYLVPRVMGGYANLDPTPVVEPGRVTFGGINAGVGMGVEYATSLSHFSVGADLSARWIFEANVPSFALFPRVKYTF